jgi:diguanylate cyclase (GGDEF)-like protein
LGIITERDIVRVFSRYISQPNTDVGLLSVGELMTHNPVSIQETTSLLDALLLSRSRKLRHLPVVDESNKLLGLVTHTDMVDTYVALLARQGELENANQQLELLSLEDSLLNIGNRRALDVELALLDAQLQRNQAQSFALIMIDVDWFKRYNDHYGHPKGDEALQGVVAAIKGSMRSTDKLYRYGGEELLLLTPNTAADAALNVANRARQAVFDMALEHSESPLGVLTVSAGVAWGEGVLSSDLLDAADKALYEAKAAGRNKASPA